MKMFKNINKQTRESSRRVLIRMDFLATSISTSKIFPSLDWRLTRTIFLIQLSLPFPFLCRLSLSFVHLSQFFWCEQLACWEMTGYIWRIKLNQNESESQVFEFFWRNLEREDWARWLVRLSADRAWGNNAKTSSLQSPCIETCTLANILLPLKKKGRVGDISITQPYQQTFSRRPAAMQPSALSLLLINQLIV